MWFRLGLLAFLLPGSLAAEEPVSRLLQGTTSQEAWVVTDPDLSSMSLPKLVLPPAPPPRVRLPDVVVKSNEWKGVQCAVIEPRFAVFRHSDKWTSFWERAMAPYSPRLAQVPAVNFESDMVVGVFMGEKPYPNYEIEIRSIKEERRAPVLQYSSAPVVSENVHGSTGALEHGTTVLVVRYRDVSRMRGVFVPPFAIQPFHLKKISAYVGQVVFVKVRR